MQNNKKMKIRDAITLCGYSPAIKQDFIKFLEANYGNQKHKLYLFARNENAPKLFLLQFQVPAQFNGNSYDISLLIYFPLSFPEIEPEIFFQKIGTVKINPNCVFYIDEETLKVNYSLFYSWGKSFESFKGLISELRNQFNIAFPIFNLSSEDNSEFKNDGDCVLKKNLVKEIELLLPPQQMSQPSLQKIPLNMGGAPNNINNMNMMNSNVNNINNMNNMMSNMNLNNNNYRQPPPQKMQMPQNNNNNIYMNNVNLIPPQGNPPAHFDEEKAKKAMINLLSRNLCPKIKYAIQPITNSYLKLEKIKTDLNNKLKELSVIEKKSGALTQTINSVKNELETYTIVPQQNMDNIDLSNLDSLLIITNKDYYMRLAKEKAIEEYILIAKKAYEKQNMDFNTVLNLIRTNTRDIFFLKYKNAHPNNY